MSLRPPRDTGKLFKLQFLGLEHLELSLISLSHFFFFLLLLRVRAAFSCLPLTKPRHEAPSYLLEKQSIVSQYLIEFCLWNSEGVSLSAVNPFTVFPLEPLIQCCSSTLWFLGWQPPCHRTSLGSIMPHSTTHQTSLSLSAPLILLNYKSSILSCKMTISLLQKPSSSESVSLTTSPAASLVSLTLITWSLEL